MVESPRPRADSLKGLSVCLVGINYGPDSTGIAPYNEAMAKAFGDAGADVHVVTGIPHYPEWKVKDSTYLHGSRWEESLDGIRVTRLRHHVPRVSNLVGRARMEVSFLLRALRAVRRDRSDIVVAVTPSMAGLAAAVFGRKGRPLGVLVQDLTGNAAGESGTTGGRVARRIASMEYAMIRKAAAVGIITPQFGAVLIKHGVSPSVLADLPNFTHITPTSSTAEEARSVLGWTQAFTVVHTGNMGMKQGLESVIEAARYSEGHGLGVEFVLVGDGNQRESLMAAGEGISTLRFVKPLSAEQYPFALAAADVLLINERAGVKEMSLPSKLTSYTSANRPILAAVEPGGITFDAIQQDQAAMLVLPGAPDDLALAASRIRDESATAVELSVRAREMFLKRYSPSAAKARYVEFAERLGGKR